MDQNRITKGVVLLWFGIVILGVGGLNLLVIKLGKINDRLSSEHKGYKDTKRDLDLVNNDIDSLYLRLVSDAYSEPPTPRRRIDNSPGIDFSPYEPVGNIDTSDHGFIEGFLALSGRGYYQTPKGQEASKVQVRIEDNSKFSFFQVSFNNQAKIDTVIKVTFSLETSRDLKAFNKAQLVIENSRFSKLQMYLLLKFRGGTYLRVKQTASSIQGLEIREILKKVDALKEEAANTGKIR